LENQGPPGRGRTAGGEYSLVTAGAVLKSCDAMPSMQPRPTFSIEEPGQYGSGAARAPRWCMYLGLFLLICGSQLWLIHAFANATPYWDEWDTEAKVIKAYVEGTFTPKLLFENQNEHRIALTETLVLSLFCANKQWDPILQMVAQAPIYAASILLFVSAIGRYMSPVGRVSLAGFAACLGVIPFAWKDVLWGIMSCFYFLILLGILLIWICWRYEAFTWGWWLGALVALANLFTMAGGVFAVVVITGFLAVRLVCERGKEWKRGLAGVGVLAAIAALGVLTTPLHAVDKYMAPNFKAFLWALTGILSWPCGIHWVCVIIQAPLIILALVTVFQRARFDDARWFVLLTAASFWMQGIVVAYKRCELWDSRKYMDFWALLLLISCSSLYFLHRSLGERWRYPVYGLAGLWLAACIYGGFDHVVNLLPREIQEFHSDQLAEENNTRQYLATGNPVYLQGKIPLDSADALRALLDSQTIRRILPSNLINPNPPLVPAKEEAGGSIVPNGVPSGMPPMDKPVFGSYTAGGVKAKGGLTLRFSPPRGAREVDLQVAGNPNARGITFKIEGRRDKSYNIVPAIDPGDNWQTIWAPLDRKSSSFKITAKDQSDGAWIAFSMPTVSTGAFPGRWARMLADDFFYLIDAGLVLLVLGAIGSIGNRDASVPSNPQSGQSTGGL